MCVCGCVGDCVGKMGLFQSSPALLLPPLLLLLLLLPTESVTLMVMKDDGDRVVPLIGASHHHTTTVLNGATHHRFDLDGIRARNMPDKELVPPQNGVEGTTIQDTAANIPTNTNGIVVERRLLRLAVFADPSLLQLLASTQPHHPPTAAHRYITTTISAVEELLQQGVGSSVELKIKLVSIGVWAEDGALPLKIQGLAGSALHSFCGWASQRRPPWEHPSHWHHAILLTGNDLFESTSSSLGVTYVGGLCHPLTSCSVVNAQSFKSVYVAAHELAHSMGVPHDGALHCPKEGFLMGQSLTQESFHWSTCSKDAFADIIKKDKCMEVVQVVGRGAVPIELDHNRGGPPGHRYTADAQCILAFGTNYRAMESTRNICEYLMCTNGLKSQGAHPALAGTSCGNNLVCVAGTCQKNVFHILQEITSVVLPTLPTTLPPIWPPTRPLEGGSVFPPAYIPSEVSILPIPLRCTILPPFLHFFIGCSSTSSSAGDSLGPEHSLTRGPLPFPALGESGIIVSHKDINADEGNSTDILHTPSGAQKILRELSIYLNSLGSLSPSSGNVTVPPSVSTASFTVLAIPSALSADPSTLLASTRDFPDSRSTFTVLSRVMAAPSYVTSYPSSFVTSSYVTSSTSYVTSSSSYVTSSTSYVTSSSSYVTSSSSYVTSYPSSFVTSTPSYVTSSPSSYITASYITSSTRYVASSFFTSSPSYATSSPSYVTSSPSYTTSSPRYVTSSPSYVTSSPSYTTSSPSYVTFYPSYVTSSPRYTTSSPSYVTSSPSYVTSSPSYATSSPSYVTPSPTYVTSSPSYVTPSPSYVTSSPSYVTSSSSYVTSSTSYFTFSPSYVTSSPSYVTSSPRYVTSSPSYVTSSPSYVTSSPSYVTSSPSYTTSSPSYTTSSPSYATSSPSYVTSSPNYATPSPSSFVTPSPSYVSSYPSYVTSSPSILVTSPSNYVISSRYGTASPSPSIIPASPSIVPATPSKDVLNDVEITQSLVEPKIEHVQKRKRENGPELIHGQTYVDEDEMDFVEMDQISNPGNKLINQGEEFRVANNATGNEGEESEEESDVILTLDQTSINNNHTEMTPIDPTKPMVHRISDQEPINGGEEEAVFSVGNFDLTGSDFHFSFPSQYFQDLFIPLLKRITRGGSISSQNTTKNITIPSTSPTKASTSNSNSGDDASTSIKHRKGTKPIRLAFLREAARVEPILAVTAPAHTRANLIGSCTHSCGGGTRLVTQVCVDLMSPEKQVDEELCEGLPNYKAPFNQSCNTFPCQTPGWVVGPWSLCSEWCGVGLQHRLVQCAVPLVPGTSSVTAGYYLAPSRCIGDQPKQARLCDGPCLPVDCNLEKNVLHPACYYLLQDTPLEQDHSQ